MGEVREAMARILDGSTLADVLEKIDSAEEGEKGILNFCI